VRHVSGEAVPDARLSLTVPTGLTPTAVGTNALGCSLTAGAVTCTPVALAVGASQSVTVTLAADSTTGSRQINAAVAATLGDPLTADNNTAASVTVQAPAAAGGSGGGGGRLSPEELAALSALLLLAGYRNRRRPRLQAARAIRRA
jgi:ABC-type amino acid transport system permease subunit